MFLAKTIKMNPALVDYALSMEKQGRILPDSFVVDMDGLLANAAGIAAAAKAHGLRLYYMLKQLGRNPYIAKRLGEIGGYEGAVAVDWKEALLYRRRGVPLGHVGHLVQCPWRTMRDILSAGVGVLTLYSVQKAREADAAAKELGIVQNALLRVFKEGDELYPSQEGGFALGDLPQAVEEIRGLSSLRIVGATSFPCALCKDGEVHPTPNAESVMAACHYLEGQGMEILQANMASVACRKTVPLFSAIGATHTEPGHGLSGTTPLKDEDEIPSVVYVTEVSHTYKGNTYCYGGGHYRRSNLLRALVGTEGRLMDVIPLPNDCIDYHFLLRGEAPASSPVAMAFRMQIFMTRSDVVLVEGLGGGSPRIAGVYSALGEEKWAVL